VTFQIVGEMIKGGQRWISEEAACIRRITDQQIGQGGSVDEDDLSATPRRNTKKGKERTSDDARNRRKIIKGKFEKRTGKHKTIV